jgi:Zn-dependent protease with chaperone function
VLEALRPRQPEPLRVTGVEVGSERLRELTAQVERVAKKLNVSAPARVIVGLEVAAFVTRIPVSLRGVGVLDAGEMLYLPACALRILEEKQLDALLGHELAHCRGKDVAFTERFIPSFLALRNAIETLSPDTNLPTSTPGSGWSVLPKLPGLLLMQLIAMVMATAVARIRREREFEADRVGAEVGSAEALARALIKISLLTTLWIPFRAAKQMPGI